MLFFSRAMCNCEIDEQEPGGADMEDRSGYPLCGFHSLAMHKRKIHLKGPVGTDHHHDKNPSPLTWQAAQCS